MDANPFRFCPACGREGPAWSEGKRSDCPACHHVMFVNPACAAACFVCRGPLVLFAVRGREPGAGRLDLPGGFIDPGESASGGLARELAEELGLAIDEARLRFLFSFPNRYPYRGVTYDTCDLFFRLDLGAHDPEPTAADDVAALTWRDPTTLAPGELAFDSMRRALAAWNRQSAMTG